MKKIKEIIKITAVCALSIAMFGAAFAGINRVAFAAATNGSTPLDVDEAQFTPVPTTMPLQIYEPPAHSMPQEATGSSEFIAPNITIMPVRDHNYHIIPGTVMSMEEAAQVGAEYIWDVFGRNIDGMYVSMFYSAWLGHGREHWHGQVFMTGEAMRSNDSFNPIFMFAIDSTTGKRIDISYTFQRGEQFSRDIESAVMEWRLSDDMIVFREMDDNQLMVHFDFSMYMLEEYRQRALEYAQRHFNDSTVMNIMLGRVLNDAAGNLMFIPGLNPSFAFDEDGNVYTTIGSITFTVTDHTGREAEIMMSTEESLFQSVHIFTQHNDRIQDFVYPSAHAERG